MQGNTCKDDHKLSGNRAGSGSKNDGTVVLGASRKLNGLMLVFGIVMNLKITPKELRTECSFRRGRDKKYEISCSCKGSGV